MITLTTPVAIPNINRIRLARLTLFDSAATAVCVLECISPGGTPRVKSFEVQVTNGQCGSIVISGSPTAFDGDVVYGPNFANATGYDQVEAAYAGANKAARIRSVEAVLLSLGVIAAALTGVVS